MDVLVSLDTLSDFQSRTDGLVDGQIVGQGGPSNAIFAQLWGNLATKYASQPKVIFGIMNEPWGGRSRSLRSYNLVKLM